MLWGCHGSADGDPEESFTSRRSSSFSRDSIPSASTRYRCHVRSGPRTQSSLKIPSGMLSSRNSLISCPQDLRISEILYCEYFSLLIRTRLVQPLSLMTKSKGSFATVTSPISMNPHAVALRCASPIPTTGLYPRVILPHLRAGSCAVIRDRKNPDPVFCSICCTSGCRSFFFV